MNPDQLAQVLVQRGGYNPTDAANAARGPRAAELSREFGGSSSTTSSGGDINAIAQNLTAMNAEANKPVIQSYQAQIPEIKAGYEQQRQQLEAQRNPLQQRYQNIIDSLKGRETKETTQQQTALSQEYGKRGIPLSSGAFQQDLLGKTQDISQNYGGQIKDVALTQEQSLADLASKIQGLYTQQTAEERAVQNAIAQLQAGGAKDAITQALQQYQFQKQQEAAQAARDEAAKQAAEDQKFKEMVYQQTTLPESKAKVSDIYSTIRNRGEQTSGNDAKEIQRIFNNTVDMTGGVNVGLNQLNSNNNFNTIQNLRSLGTSFYD